MTVETGFYEPPEDYLEEDIPLPLVPVPVVGKMERDEAPHFGALSNFVIPVAPALPLQILQRRPSRKRAYIVVNSDQFADNLNSIQATGSVAAGFAAPATVASMTLQPGVYTVGWIVNIGGVPTAADANNVQLVLGGNVIETGVTSTGSTSNFQQQTPITIVVPVAETLAMVLPAAGSGAASWRGQMVATPQVSGSGPAVQINTNPGALQAGVGFLVDSALRYDAQQPVYALVPAGGAPLAVSVLDESYYEEVNP